MRIKGNAPLLIRWFARRQIGSPIVYRGIAGRHPGISAAAGLPHRWQMKNY